MLELYHAPISTCSQKVRLVLAEKGLDWTSHKINFASGDHLSSAYLKTPVRPSDMKARARMRAWRQYIDEVPTPAIRVPSFNAYFVPIWSGLSEEQFQAYAKRLPLRQHFYQRMGRQGFSEHDVGEALDKLRQTLTRMEAALETGPWLNGADYSLADISITPTIVRMEDLGLHTMWAERPAVTDWYRRIQARPNFAVAYMPGSRDLGPSC
jgi:glutathione S-transferase